MWRFLAGAAACLLEMRDERAVESRSFPDWSMDLVRASASYFEPKDTVSHRLPDVTAPDLRYRLIRITEAVSGTVAF